jgi:hypothetical protein
MGFHKDEYDKSYQSMAPNESIKPSQALDLEKQLDKTAKSMDELSAGSTSEDYNLNANVGFEDAFRTEIGEGPLENGTDHPPL